MNVPAKRHDEDLPPSRLALAALERLIRHVDSYHEQHADHALVARFICDIEPDIESTRRYSEHQAAQAGGFFARTQQMEADVAQLRRDLHAVATTLAAVQTSGRALLLRLDEFDAGDLYVERGALARALASKRLERLSEFIARAVGEHELRQRVRALCRNLSLAPEGAKDAERWMMERTKRGPGEWWSR